MDHLEDEDKPLAVDDVKGILVASDNATIVDEVPDLARAYVPRVRSEAIVFVSDGVPGGVKNPGMTTRTRDQVILYWNDNDDIYYPIFIIVFSSRIVIAQSMIVAQSSPG